MAAPKLPKDINYWLKKGKSGKDVCLITHDDLDGIVSAIIMKNYLIHQGFTIKKYGIINYQEGVDAFKLDNSLINITLDFANDDETFDYYVDHHGIFSEEEKIKAQKKGSIKTNTGSAAEGLAIQLGIPFSNDTKDWIDMIDSAKYDEYDVDIKGILDFDLNNIINSPNAKLNFAASFNQMLKRSDHKTFIEVINASNEPSIYNIFRLFKIFYPKNNPNFKNGDEPEFVSDAYSRLSQMKTKTRGIGDKSQGFTEDGKKIIFSSQDEFWKKFAQNIPYINYDDDGNAINSDELKWQVKPVVYQIIGNLMYVPSGTWANALRAKSIFSQDVESGIIKNNPKLNFVLLQYGNTLQIANLTTKMSDMSEEDLPKDKNGLSIDNLGSYMNGLLKNFNQYMDYNDERTVAGGHPGIGSISNIFKSCKKDNYKNIKFLDLLRNKIINDISGVKWGITMAWNESDEKGKVFAPDEVNKKLMDINNISSENDIKVENDEIEILNYIITNSIKDENIISKFKNDTIRKIYDIWLDTDFNEIKCRTVKSNDLEKIYFKRNKDIENSILFEKIYTKFELNDIYSSTLIDARKTQRKELKRIFKYIFNIMNRVYIKNDTNIKFEILLKNTLI